nr:hypothetical protein [uncultured Campylobacter sp.]
MERRSGSVRRSSATVFQGVSRRKTSRSFCVSRWAAQAVSAKNRPQAEPANSPAGQKPHKEPRRPKTASYALFSIGTNA